MAGRAHNPDHIYNPVSVGGEGPKPSLWQNFDSNIELAQDRSGYNRYARQKEAYDNIYNALSPEAQNRVYQAVGAAMRGGRAAPVGTASAYSVKIEAGQTSEQYEVMLQKAIWAEMEAARGKGQGFKAIPATQAEYDEQLRQGLIAQRNVNKRTASRAEGVSGWLSGFVGSAAGSLSDPVNFWGAAVSGPTQFALKPLLTSAAINSGIEALTIPGANKELAYFDDKETLSEQVFNVAAAGVGGALLPVAIKGTAAGVSKAIDVVPWQKAAALAKPAQEALWAKMIGVLPPAAQRKLAGKLDWDALDDHLPDLVEGLVGRDNLSVDEKLAVTMLRRKNEVEAANPYRPTGVGITAHNAAFDAHIRRVASDIVEMRRPRNLVQAATDGPSSIAGSGGQSTTITVPGKKGQVGFAQDIYQFFKAKGYTHEQARGIAAGIHAESASNHNIRGGYKGRALGIGQWLGDRRAEIIRRHGPNPTRQQQLEFLHEELQGRDAGGKAVLAAKDEAAVLDAYIRKFMRPAAGSQTTGDLKRGMSALGRGGESMTFREEAGGGGTAADLPEIDPEAEATAAIAARGAEIEAERAVLAREANADDIVPVFDANGVKSSLQSFRPGDIDVDARLMQFKSGGDDFGVTERLRGVQQWDPIAAGSAVVWESIDGRRLIADGHQRLGLAKRLQAADPNADIMLDARVLREADGISARDARIITALKNIGEGTGTSADAAKVFREGGAMAAEALANRLPPKSALVRDGKALSRLSDEAFGAIVNEVVPEHWGAVIGHLAPDPDTHMALIDLLAKIDPPNRRQAEGIIRQALEAGFSRETQEELFGSRDVATALFAQRARAVDRTLAELRKLKGVFSVAARNVDTLESAGNRIDAAASMMEADGNAMALGILESLAYRKGHVGDIFNTAAQRLANGEPIGRVVADVVAEVRKLDLQSVARESGGVGGDSGSIDGSGRSGQPDGQNQSAFEDQLGPNDLDDGLEPRDAGGLTAEERAQLEYEEPGFALFDDPVGPGPKAMADGIKHDLEAGLNLADDVNIAADPLAKVAFAAREGADETAEQAIKSIEAEEAALKALRDCL